jgi:hypothetical protein
MIGMVAAKAHQNGSRKSESSPNSKKTNQKIFRCIAKIVRQILTRPSVGNAIA